MVFHSQTKTESEFVELRGFPGALRARVESVLRVLVKGQMHDAHAMAISVHFMGELINIPYRTCYDNQQLLSCIDLPGEAGEIALCLGTRHSNGFVREKCLRRLLTVESDWIAPFVLQPLGEYVIEIVRPISDALAASVDTKYANFYAENACYFQYLEQRAVSYWNVYYRFRFPKLKDYPALKAFAALRTASNLMQGKST